MCRCGSNLYPVMEDHTVKCTLIDANSDPVYELGDNKVVYGLEVRDDLLYLRYGTYGKEDTNVLIYDTISKKIVLNEMNIDSWSIPKDHSSHVVSLQKGNKAALFNTLDRTFPVGICLELIWMKKVSVR